MDEIEGRSEDIRDSPPPSASRCWWPPLHAATGVALSGSGVIVEIAWW